MSSHVDVLARSLSRSGCTVRVYTLASSGVTERTRRDGVFVQPLQAREFFVYDVARELSAHMRHWRPDILHFHGILAGLAATITAKPERTRIVVTIHTLWDADGRYTPRSIADIREVQRLFLRSRHIDRFITVSGFLATASIKEGCPSGRIHVVRNAVDVSAFGDAATRNTPLPDRFPSECRTPGITCVLVLSRLSPEKGVVEFVQAFTPVLRRHETIHLILAGDRQEDEYSSVRCYRRLCAQIQSTGVARERVHLLGNVPYSKVPRLLRASDVVVVPSFHEGLSMAAIEAIAAGRPVVAFAVRGMDEVIRAGRNGLLAEPGDYDELIAHVLALAMDRNARRQLGRNARDSARRCFDLSRMTRATLTVYSKSVAGKS